MILQLSGGSCLQAVLGLQCWAGKGGRDLEERGATAPRLALPSLIWREVSPLHTPGQQLLYLLTILHLYPQKPPPRMKHKLPSFCHSTGVKKQHCLPHRPNPESQGLLCPYANTQATHRAPPETK